MRVAVGLARQPPADFARQLDRLEREIERLDSLISQVLKLARLHGSDTPFTRETLDLDEVIEEVVRDANFEGAVKNCRVRLHGAAYTCATRCATVRAMSPWTCRWRAANPRLRY
jgi:signal transduction histidine kinase